MKTPSRVTRRNFLTQTAATAGALAVAPTFAYAAESAGPRHDPYERIQIGRTDLRFPRLCMGTGVRGGNRKSNHTRMGKENLERLIRDAYERGVRLYDLADMYGTHPYLIPALQKIPRQDYGIITKIWFRPGGIPEKERPDADVLVERFLKELKTDYIDMLLLHCVVSPKWPQECQKQMEIIARLKEKGVVRAHGVSCHSLEALQAAVTEPWVDSVHARINHTGAKMDGPPEKVAPVLKQLCDAGKGVVGMKLIGEGDFSKSDEQRDASVKYVLGLGCVQVLNVGFENKGQIDDFAARVRKVRRA